VFTFLSAGLVFGLSSGFSPGPLLALVIVQSVQHGFREGAKAAFAPLITDLPIVLFATLLLSRLAQQGAILGVISLAGGLFVLYLAYESFRTKPLEMRAAEGAPRTLRKAALVNFLSPHPYLFWLTVGSPMLIRAHKESFWPAAAFVLGFYVCLIGSKLLTAFVAGRSRQWLVGRPYVYLMRGLGLLLLVFAVLLLREGLRLLGAWPA